MAPAPVDPGNWSPQSVSLFEWVVTGAATVLTAIGGFIVRLVRAMSRRLAALEAEQARIDHDMKGVRQGLISLEVTTERRHGENAQRHDSLREWLEGRLDRLEDRIENRRSKP